MTLVSDLISRAFRSANIRGLGLTPTDDQNAEALPLLQSIINSIFGTEVGENLSDWPLGLFGRDDPERQWMPDLQVLQRPMANHRLIATNTAAMTVYLPTRPCDGARMAILDPFSRLATVPVTIDGNGRAIEGAATLVLNTNAASFIWMYRADLGNWVRTTPLVLANAMPFPDDFDDFFVTMLAMRQNPSYGKTLDPALQAILKRTKAQIMARYAQSAPLEANHEISFMSRQTYGNWNQNFNGDSQAAWNRGWGW